VALEPGSRFSAYSIPLGRRFRMKVGYLVRVEDESGVSGTGRVAEVVQSDTGKCVVFWLGQHPSVIVYDNVGEIRAVHGHGGKTEIRWEPDWKRAYNELKSVVENVTLIDLMKDNLPKEGSEARDLMFPEPPKSSPPPTPTPTAE